LITVNDKKFYCCVSSSDGQPESRAEMMSISSCESMVFRRTPSV